MNKKQKLVFFLSERIDPESIEVMRRIVNRANQVREYLLGPIQFVDAVDEEDDSIRTIGGVLELYDSRNLDLETDWRQLRDVEAAVEIAKEESLLHSVEIEFELDGIFVGEIIDGTADECLEIGLLGEWKRVLEERQAR